MSIFTLLILYCDFCDQSTHHLYKTTYFRRRPFFICNECLNIFIKRIRETHFKNDYFNKM